jgi:hypothetical protein
MEGALNSIIVKGSRGAIAGSLFGFALGAAGCVANMILFEQEKHVHFKNSKSKTLKFRYSDNLEKYNFKDDIKILFKYRKYDQFSYNRAAVHTQHLIDIYDSFCVKIKNGKDVVKSITKFHAGAMKADEAWRNLFYSVQKAGDVIGLEEARGAAMNLHVSFEGILASMRDELVDKSTISKKS